MTDLAYSTSFVIAMLAKLALVVQQGKDAPWPGLDSIQTIPIVQGLDERTIDLLPLVLLLLLEGLICEVDAQLFKGIDGDAFKAEDVQHLLHGGPGVLTILPLDAVVHLAHHPKEHGAVDSLR